MKFGIFYELQLPRPWQAGDELRLYQDALLQLETADRLGYDHAWVVEHHFLEEYSHSPSPESFLVAASQRTKNIRRRFRSSHIDQVILLNQAGKNSHEHICDSLEMFAREVMPEFRADPEHDAWKAGVMSGTIQLEEIDTEAFTDRYGRLGVNIAPAKPAAVAAG
jgi:hypothetical protein